jgi:diguanylate cyclase (GGDEF)-like protein
MLPSRPARALFLAVCLLTIAASACAQRFRFETYDQRQGLKNLDVRSLLQDRAGLMWFGTESGLYRYDGYRFEMMPLPEAKGAVMIVGLAEDGHGRIWYSTPDSLGYLEGSKAREVHAPDGSFLFELIDRLAVDPVDPDRIFFVSRHTLYSARVDGDGAARVAPVISGSQLAEHPALKALSALAASADHSLWVGCGQSLCSVRDGAIRVFSSNEGVPADAWRQIFVDRGGTVWARSERHMIRLEPHADRFSDAGKGLSPAWLEVREPQFGEDPQGRLLAIVSVGLARFQGDSWQVFHEGTELPASEPTAVLTDRQGSIWLGLNGHGAGRWLGYEQWESLTTANGLTSNVVWNMTRDAKGNLWIATERDLERMGRDGKIEPQKAASGTALQRVQALDPTGDGHVWTGSDNGQVVDFDPATRNARLVGQKLGGVFQISPAENGEKWICATTGLYRVGAGDRGVAVRQGSPAPQGRVYGEVQDRSGHAWFLADAGLFRYAAGGWTHIQIPPDYRADFAAQIVMAPDGTLWISGASPALLHLAVTGETARELQRVESPPLTSPTVYLAGMDRRGWLWVGTDEGLDVFDGKRWQHLGSDDGMAWNDTNSDAFYEDADGSIWIGTSGGLAHILHPETIFKSQPLTILLSHVSVGGVEVEAGKSVTVPWSNKPLKADLSTLDFTRASQVTFRYRVEGINEVWQDSPKHDLRYPPLAPGRYTLVAMAVDAGHTSAPAYVTFRIAPPWWRTVYMYSAEGALGLLLLAALWRWSLRRHVVRERRLEELVQRRTRELEFEKAELLIARAALEEQATHDSLTGLLNHGAILEALDHAMKRSLRDGSTLGIVLADLDHFKRVNDTYGHLAGDQVLQEYGQRVSQSVRPYDDVGRYGGEELLIILPGFDREGAMERLTGLHAAICGQPFECHGDLIPVTCSFGFTWLSPEDDTISSMVDRADRAMYAAKDRGRNRIEICEAGDGLSLRVVRNQP